MEQKNDKNIELRFEPQKVWILLDTFAKLFKQMLTSLYTLKNSAFGASEIDTPIEDQKIELSFCRENSRVRSGILDRGRRFPMPGHSYTSLLYTSDAADE